MKITPRVLSLLATLLVVAGVTFGLMRINALEDWWKLRGYTPPTDIVNLANQDTFSDYTRHLFYVNHPQLISGVTAFRQDCPENAQTIVLGCYHPDQDGIYIFNVQDPSLAGIQQVTAAHEVLHSVYARLSGKDRSALDAALESYYKTGLTDSRVIAEVKIYQQTEPDDVMDEMSCTFGTEIANLPPALEAYYSHYFNNRQAIVTFEQNYENEFTNRENQISADDARLATMKAQIQADEASLNSQLASLQADRASVENSSDEAAVQSYNSRVEAYNAGVRRLQAEIASYNSLVDQRNAIASALASLQKSIDTRLTPQPTQ